MDSLLPPPMSVTARRLAGLCAQLAAHDWQWQAMGFSGCPKRGALFTRFVGARRLAQERFLLREFAIAGLATGLQSLAGSHSALELDEIAEVAISCVAAADGVPKAIGFKSSDELSEYFATGLAAYRATSASHASVFFQRSQSAPGAPFRPAWLVGIGRLFGEPGAPLVVLRAEIEREWSR